MKKLFIGFLLVTGFCSQAQIKWVKNYDVASSMAVSANKFIVMDFWAIWCGPCKIMDREMWNNTSINEVSSNFIPLKVDIDYSKALASKYGVRGIPMVVIIDPMGNVIWKQVGYSSSNIFMAVFKEIPKSILPAKAMSKETSKSGDSESWEQIALAYQRMGKDNSSAKLQNGFFHMSDKYFLKVKKNTNSQELILRVELNQILNDAYRGRVKQALKQLAKVDAENIELKNYIQAYCYKCTGDNEQMERYKKLIKDPDLLAQLQE